MFCFYLTLAFLGTLVSPSLQAVTTCYVATVVSGSNTNLTAMTCSASNTFGGGAIYNYYGVIIFCVILKIRFALVITQYFFLSLCIFLARKHIYGVVLAIARQAFLYMEA